MNRLIIQLSAWKYVINETDQNCQSRIQYSQKYNQTLWLIPIPSGTYVEKKINHC